MARCSSSRFLRARRLRARCSSVKMCVRTWPRTLCARLASVPFRTSSRARRAQPQRVSRALPLRRRRRRLKPRLYLLQHQLPLRPRRPCHSKHQHRGPFLYRSSRPRQSLHRNLHLRSTIPCRGMTSRPTRKFLTARPMRRPMRRTSTTQPRRFRSLLQSPRQFLCRSPSPRQRHGPYPSLWWHRSLRQHPHQSLCLFPSLRQHLLRSPRKNQSKRQSPRQRRQLPRRQQRSNS